MAELIWKCPNCEYTKKREGTCRQHYVALELVKLADVVCDEDSPPPEPAEQPANQACRLALDTPWQRIELPPGRVIVVGRDFMPPTAATRFDHVSRRHVAVVADPSSDTALVTDVRSTNRTYVGDVEIAAGQDVTLHVGESIRLGRAEGADTVTCTLVRLPESGDAT